MSDKPPFDPNAAFTTAPPAADQSNGAVGMKPAFDPSKPFSASKPEELPDVGGPAITAGQDEFSPGMPAVNAFADRASASAEKNIFQPIKHPIDTAMGIGKTLLGAAQYAGLPGDQFKPDVDALIADYAKTYGSWEGLKSAVSNDPFRVAMDATLLASPLGIARRGAARAARVEAPSIAELYDAADGHYNAMHGFGVELKPQVLADTASNIDTELKTAGYRDYLAPKTFKAVDELRNPDGPTMTTQEVEGVRRALNKAAFDPAERDAARRAINEIDSTMAGLTPADAVVNGHFAPRVAEEAAAARGNYAAAKRADQIGEAKNKADLQAASTGSGANIDNATRQQIKNLLNNPKKVRGFSEAEKAQMRQIVQGTFAGNAARLLGKLAPSGIVSGGLSAGLGHMVGHTVGVPVLGAVAKKLGDAATQRAVARASEMARLRSPLARALGAQPNPSALTGAAQGAVNAFPLTRLNQEP